MDLILTGGFTTKIDKESYSIVSKWKWQKSGNGYSVRNHWDGSKYTKMYMHRLIMGTPKGMDTDHINGDKLDNRKKNLRIVDRATNNHNSLPSKNNTSGHKGVSWFKPANLWRAYIKYNTGKRIELGYFKTKELAIGARVKAERELGL